MKTIIAALAVVALTGCATAQPAATTSPDVLQQISQFTIADLQAADADAVANNDVIAHACYPALEQFVKSLPGANGTTTVAGAFSAFQQARDLRNSVAAGIPTYLTMGCGPLYAQVHGDLLKAIAGGFAGQAIVTVATAP